MTTACYMCEKCGARLQRGDGMVFWDIGDWWHVPCARIFIMDNQSYAAFASEGKLVKAPFDLR